MSVVLASGFSMNKMTHRAAVKLLWALALLIVAGGCSLTQDFGECSQDSDCASYGPYMFCADDKICARRSSDEVLSDECRRTYLNVEEEGTVIVGLILPLTGPLKGMADSIEQAIKLAVKDINEIEGLNGSKVALVICDSAGEQDSAQASADHLTDTLGVEVIIGPVTSSNAFSLGTKVLKQKNVLMLSPAVTSASITNLDDGGYFWRTTSTDLNQGSAMAKVLAGPMLTASGKTAAEVRVAVVQNTNEIYAEGLYGDFRTQLEADGVLDIEGANFERITYTSETTSTAIGLLSNLDPRPEIVIFFGLPEVWDVMLNYDLHVKDNLGREDTLYLFSDLGRDIQRAELGGSTLEGRLWGTSMESRADTPAFESFRARFQSDYLLDPAKLQFVSNAFDAVYTLAIAAHGRPLTGASLAEGMQLLAGTENSVDATREGLQTAFNHVGQGQPVQLVGASGVLDFDAATGDLITKRSTVLWCFEEGGFIEKGVVWDGTTFTEATCSTAAEP